jgi:heptosyltransferase-1
MRVLVIKTSSMGDIIHTLPAITDAVKAIPGIKFDWLVEENFAEIPGWHPAVDNIIKVAWRRWRKTFWKASTWLEWREFRAQLAAKHYDVIIDAQGLIKSAFFSKLATGIRCGFATDSVRERFASLFYQKKYSALAVFIQSSLELYVCR